MGCVGTDGSLFTWGRNTTGNLGLNDRTEYSSPKYLSGGGWANISMDQNKTMATKTDGTLWVWGEGSVGELGQNQTSVQFSSPVQIPGTAWTNIYASNGGMSALQQEG